MQREIPEWVNTKIAQHSNYSILDVGGDNEQPISDDLMTLLQVISPNETELACVLGK